MAIARDWERLEPRIAALEQDAGANATSVSHLYLRDVTSLLWNVDGFGAPARTDTPADKGGVAAAGVAEPSPQLLALQARHAELSGEVQQAAAQVQEPAQEAYRESVERYHADRAAEEAAAEARTQQRIEEIWASFDRPEFARRFLGWAQGQINAYVPPDQRAAFEPVLEAIRRLTHE